MQLQRPGRETPGTTSYIRSSSWRRETRSFSCRFQTSLTIERCRFACYTVAYGEDIEGPGPERIHIVDSEFLPGRNSGLNVQAGGSGAIGKTRVQEVRLERCIFRAPLTIRKARRIVLQNNQFHGDVNIGDSETLEMTGNTRNGEPFAVGDGERKEP